MSVESCNGLVWLLREQMLCMISNKNIIIYTMIYPSSQHAQNKRYLQAHENGVMKPKAPSDRSPVTYKGTITYQVTMATKW